METLLPPAAARRADDPLFKASITAEMVKLLVDVADDITGEMMGPGHNVEWDRRDRDRVCAILTACQGMLADLRDDLNAAMGVTEADLAAPAASIPRAA